MNTANGQIQQFALTLRTPHHRAVTGTQDHSTSNRRHRRPTAPTGVGHTRPNQRAHPLHRLRTMRHRGYTTVRHRGNIRSSLSNKRFTATVLSRRVPRYRTGFRNGRRHGRGHPYTLRHRVHRTRGRGPMRAQTRHISQRLRPYAIPVQRHSHRLIIVSNVRHARGNLHGR